MPKAPFPIIFPYNVYVPEMLLQTKLYVPPLRSNLVPRPHLIDRLKQGLEQGCKLTLISAPAGFGKTTLVSEWVDTLSKDDLKESPQANRIGWLSLDENDNDATRFLTYLVHTLNQEEGTEAIIGKGALGMLQSPQPPRIESVLTSLINDVTDIPERIILVLDDYHVITASSVNDVIIFLLENLPPQMHKVIVTRDDPQLSLARTRAMGHLTELRGAELRFTSSEVAEFLNRMMDLNLSEDDIALL